MFGRRSPQSASAGTTGVAREFLAWIGGLLIGIVSAYLLAGLLMLSPAYAGIDPRSMQGIIHALGGAGLALVAGMLIAFLPRSISRIAVGTTVGLLVVYGLTGMALVREYFREMELGFVMAPSCALGAVLAERRRFQIRNIAPPPGQ